jgi:hypothetical protein
MHKKNISIFALKLVVAIEYCKLARFQQIDLRILWMVFKRLFSIVRFEWKGKFWDWKGFLDEHQPVFGKFWFYIFISVLFLNYLIKAKAYKRKLKIKM